MKKGGPAISEQGDKKTKKMWSIARMEYEADEIDE